MNEQQYFKINFSLAWLYFAVFGYVQMMDKELFQIFIWFGIPCAISIISFLLYLHNRNKLKSVNISSKQKECFSLCFFWIIPVLVVLNTIELIIWILFPLAMILINLINYFKCKKLLISTTHE